jgi:hypothetical protein
MKSAVMQIGQGLTDEQKERGQERRGFEQAVLNM